MSDHMTQSQRLETLVEAFKADSREYRDLTTPPDTEGRRRLLRSLMNVRMPRPLDADTLRLQDAYLTERARERGVVSLGEIPVLRDGVSVWCGDITCLAADAIVNAANSAMLGCFVPMHSCIDNCIHTYAGVQLRADCARQMNLLRAEYGPDYRQPTAVPMLTEGYNLPAKKVIHIVGPVVEGELTPRHERELADCYRAVLELCRDNGITSVAFCGISTGVFHFPRQRACEIAVHTVLSFLRSNPGVPERVIFNVHRPDEQRRYETVISDFYKNL